MGMHQPCKQWLGIGEEEEKDSREEVKIEFDPASIKQIFHRLWCNHEIKIGVMGKLTILILTPLNGMSYCLQL